MAEAIIPRQEAHPAPARLGPGQYGLKDLYVGVPGADQRGRIREKVIEIELDDEAEATSRSASTQSERTPEACKASTETPSEACRCGTRLLAATPALAGPWIDDLGRSTRSGLPQLQPPSRLTAAGHSLADGVAAFDRLCRLKTGFDRSAVEAAVKDSGWGLTPGRNDAVQESSRRRRLECARREPARRQQDLLQQEAAV